MLGRSGHGGGFFACCSIKLNNIVQFYNTYKIFPKVDGFYYFTLYKQDDNVDITFDFFENYENVNIDFKCEDIIDINNGCFQFNSYKNVNYPVLVPFVEKYFTPSLKILEIYNNLILKYKINVNNSIGIYYRGTDKYQETILDSFDSYLHKLNELEHENKQIIIQTDSRQFLNYMNDNCKNKNIIVIDENSTSYNNIGCHIEKTKKENYIDIHNLFATFLIISKCESIICSSGNCSIWIMFFRKNAENVYQNLNLNWY
jgi:hypothetical protein